MRSAEWGLRSPQIVMIRKRQTMPVHDDARRIRNFQEQPQNLFAAEQINPTGTPAGVHSMGGTPTGGVARKASLNHRLLAVTPPATVSGSG